MCSGNVPLGPGRFETLHCSTWAGVPGSAAWRADDVGFFVFYILLVPSLLNAMGLPLKASQNVQLSF